jgi:hypothetical protein
VQDGLKVATYWWMEEYNILGIHGTHVGAVGGVGGVDGVSGVGGVGGGGVQKSVREMERSHSEGLKTSLLA